MPNLRKDIFEKERFEEEVYEQDFNIIKEDVKDLNTSQTGKGSSPEEKSHSSNIDKNNRKQEQNLMKNEGNQQKK